MPKVLLNGKLMFQSNYVSAVELAGRDVSVTIAKVTKEVLTIPGGAKDECIVFAFSGKKKRFICNRTNAKTIAEMYGWEGSAWIGKRITLYPTKTKGKGREIVDCIRVRSNGVSANSGNNTWAEDDADDSEVIGDVLSSSEEWQDDESGSDLDANAQAQAKPLTFDIADDAAFREELIGTVAGTVAESLFNSGFTKLLAEYPDSTSADVKVRTHTRLRILMAAKSGRIDWDAPTLS